jgi:hypothetical protein
MSYIFMIGSEIVLATWIWAGVRIRDLVGGRWSDWRLVLRDFAIALPSWGIWEATARLVYALLYPHSSPSNAYHVPTGLAEILLKHCRSRCAASDRLWPGALVARLEAGAGNYSARRSLWHACRPAS